MEDIKICCPKCDWEPDGKSYWLCSCDTQWDTFSTGARCPGCRKIWDKTQCPSDVGGCDKWSPHLDWYKGLDNVVLVLKEEIKKDWLIPVDS